MPVIMLHGLWMTSLELLLLGYRLRRAGFQVYRFRYPSRRATIGENAAALRDYIAHYPGAGQGVPHLVGHSLGGVVALKLLHENPKLAVGRVVALGSPFCGCWGARTLARSRLGRWMLGRCRVGTEDGDWPKSQPVGRCFGVIAGNRPAGLTYRLFPGLPAPHDGVISVAETQLSGAADFLLLPVSHMGMLADKATAQAVINFLHHGRFNPLESNPS